LQENATSRSCRHATPEPGEARREASTREKVLERLLHKPREALSATSPRRLRAERLVVIADKRVQHVLLRAARTIDKRRERHATVDGKDRARRGVAVTR
jgi:hypothetical protein